MGVKAISIEPRLAEWLGVERELHWQWHVLHVRSRQEKALAEELAAQRIAYYLPLIRQARYYGRRKAQVQVPLFPGYVFLLGSREDAFRADRTRRVASIIEVQQQERLEWELRNLSLALGRSAQLNPYPHLTEGLKVEVRSGPFCGLQGVIESRSCADRLILQVNMLGTASSLEIDGALLEPLDE